MRREDFEFELPEALIAQRPLAERSAGRLLLVDGATRCFFDHRVRDLPGLLRPGDLLVANDTRVVAARVFGRRPGGGEVEFLVERIDGPRTARAVGRPGRHLKPAVCVDLDGDARVLVRGRTPDGLIELELLAGPDWAELLERVGHVPLPPYVTRPDEALDRERYQTTWAREPGAVAAPTAGLHFDAALVAALADAGLRLCFVTLHVGLGTFAPVRESDLAGHRLHAERWRIPPETSAAIAATRSAGGRIVAIGTTTLRTLETAALTGWPPAGEGETELFVKPGFRFRAVDALFTNFHLPGSTLLMLVAAFAGRETTLRAYRHAVAEGYRFYSYGDAMLAFPAPDALRTAGP